MMNKATLAAVVAVFILGACGVFYTYTHEKATTRVVKDMQSTVNKTVDSFWDRIPPHTKTPPLIEAGAVAK